MKIYFIDSFTDQAFKGNPAAVVWQDKDLSDKLMQSIALEIGFSETAFVSKQDESSYILRWFSPKTEVGLCGHASLAAAKVFFSYINPQLDKVIFKTKYGLLTCSISKNLINIDFPQDKLYPLENFDIIKEYFGFPLKENIMFSEKNHYMSIIIPNNINLENLDINIENIKSIQNHIPSIRGLIISNQNVSSVNMRFFDPWEGIPEDPVTGSAALVVSDYWFHKLKVDNLIVEQKSSRGGRMILRKNQDKVTISGQATIILVGKLMVG